MNLDIKSVEIKPIRQTYAHVARRIGENKAATRYEEATYDLQATTNFHYLPTYNSKYEIYDENKTAIKMSDWYKLLDPRQYYYSNYVITRAKQQEVAEQNFSFIEKRDLLITMPQDIKEQILKYVVPLRHYEWGANMNNLQIVSECYGSAMANAATFHSEDRLGMAQYITKIGLLLGENEARFLDEAKDLWINENSWQGLRKVVEDSFVVEDWFELFIFQNVVMDGFVHPLFFDYYEREIATKGGNIQSMMTEFMTAWFEESNKWVDKTINVAVSESDENKKIITNWCEKYINELEKATILLAKNLVKDPENTVSEIKENLIKRLNKNGLEL